MSSCYVCCRGWQMLGWIIDGRLEDLRRGSSSRDCGIAQKALLCLEVSRSLVSKSEVVVQIKERKNSSLSLHNHPIFSMSSLPSPHLGDHTQRVSKFQTSQKEIQRSGTSLFCRSDNADQCVEHHFSTIRN